jgi:hypothetical protein
VIKELFGITLSRTGVWHYLRRLNLSHQKACRHYINADKEEIRLYCERLIDQLIALPTDGKLIFIDEFSISTRPSTYYMWGEKGKQPQIKSNERNRKRTNGFVSVDAMSGDISLWQSEVAQAQQVAEFCCREALKAQKQGCSLLKIVLDNNKTHLKKMKLCFDQLKVEQKLSIDVKWIHTAKYAPKYNLAEYIIAIIRRKALHHLEPDFTIEQVIAKLDEVLANENIQSKEQVWNTLQHIFHTAILGNYSFNEL